MPGVINYDFLLSITLFLTAYASIFYITPYFVQAYREIPDQYAQEMRYLEHVTLNTPGSPRNWTDVSSMTSFGLAAYYNQTLPGVIDPEKAMAINNTNCTMLARKAGLTENEIMIRIEWAGKTVQCTPGTSLTGTRRHILRTVSVGNQTGVVEEWVW